MYDDFTLLVDGKEAFPEILNCIRNAAKSIYINMFIWRDDAIGNRMAQAILEAAERGVRVDISADRYGVVLEKSEEAKKSFFHKKQSFVERTKTRVLEQVYPMPGAPKKAKDQESDLYRAILSHPNITVSANVFKADHSKYYIFDDEILIMGGINIEDKENGQDMQGRIYQDYMVKMVGRRCVDALRMKLEKGIDLWEDWFFGVNCKGPVRRFEMENLYLKMIQEAERELYITMAYFSPLEHFLQAIVDAQRQGVRVTAMIPARANYQSDSNRKTVRRLLERTENGITVYLSPKMLHTKLVATEKQISFGSTNITKKAFGQLDELNLFIQNEDCPFVRQLFASMKENYALAHRVSSWEEIEYRAVLAGLEGLLV